MEGEGFLLDKQTYTLYMNNKSTILSRNQGKLLAIFLENKNELITREKLSMALFFCLLLWIADVQAFIILSLVLILLSALLFVTVLWITVHHEIKLQDAIRNYINAPTEQNEEILLNLCSDSDKTLVRLLGDTLRQRTYDNEQLSATISEYEEYVETWAHEAKTPISLLTMLLDNHSDEIPADILKKMDHIRNRLQECVDQMLFYARLKSEKKDYYFERINLAECIGDILEDYQPLLEEKNFVVEEKSLEINVFSDKRGLRFLISQIISNSIKYVRTICTPRLEVKCEVKEKSTELTITDNGSGVRQCDLPYIFEKGFTGDSGENRKKATGMGLYLVKEIAKDLKLELDVDSEWMKGFQIKIIFPQI